MKRKKAALYDPYLDILGGGEKHILSILKVLEEEGYDVSIFWDKNLSQEIEKTLHLSFQSSPLFSKNIFPLSGIKGVIQKFSILSEFDIFLYVTNGSYFFSGAKKNIVFSMVPDKKLYNMNALNRLKTLNSQFISNSNFTKSILEKNGIHSEYIYPYIEEEYLDINTESLKKEKIILSVGRFFKHLHAKRQDIMIEYFKKMKKEMNELKDFSLVLVGGLKEEDMDYFHELEKLIDGDSSIILKPNLSYNEKMELYIKALFYWHFAGYEVDEVEHPEFTEHLGITPLEAMAAGCVDFCYKAGGLKEIVEDEKTGFLFKDYNELKTKTENFLHHEEQQKRIQANAKNYLKKNFSYPVFKENVKKIILK